MKINIIFPFIPRKPGGGLRVLFEYANWLGSFGHKITVYYPCFVNHEEGFVKYFKYHYLKRWGGEIPNWFKLDKNIEVRFIKTINNTTIQDADIILSTWWSIMFDLKDIKPQKGVKFNLVQDIENWNGNDSDVIISYTIANAYNVVIADYLYKYLKDVTGIYPYKIPLAIDKSKYNVLNNIQDRDPKSICMMYSTEPRKGSVFGMEALQILKNRIPDISVKLFSIYEKPKILPEWITYHYRNSKLEEIYNSCAIFLGPSVQEGCALPPMEAMYCGCAVVCTNIDGHKDYAFDNETAIFAEQNNPADMAAKMENLILNNDHRIAIAVKANEFITKYTWENSSKKLEDIFISALNK